MRKHYELSSVPAFPDATFSLVCSSPLLYLSQWKPMISLKVSLNPNKINTFLLSATTHAPCSDVLLLCVALFCINPLARLWDPLMQGPSLFIFIPQLWTYNNKHLIKCLLDEWINFVTMYIQSLEIFCQYMCNVHISSQTSKHNWNFEILWFSKLTLLSLMPDIWC